MLELILGGIVAAVLLIWFVSTWNRLVRLEKNVEQSWANIDVLLKQRYDMIPNLVNTVKGYATHEREIFEQARWPKGTWPESLPLKACWPA